MMIVLPLLAVLAISACNSDSPKPGGLLPEISDFLSTHSEFGEPRDVQEIPDWAKGPRQRVTFDNGRNLLFYIEGDSVVSVYEDGSNGRQKVWGQ
jgi:hypothetical protein